MQKPFKLHSTFPWIIAAAALVLYLVTLNPWVTLTSVGPVNQVTGWESVPVLNRPLLWLITRPFTVLSGNAQILALNGLSALLAALSLAQLVRTVSILPQDRTRDQRQRETHPSRILSGPLAWLPPLVAAAVLGFQPAFWEQATAHTGEMLDLFILSLVIRCLMEDRLVEHNRWALALTFLVGAGAANSWAMIAVSPFLLFALIWNKPARFIGFDFLAKGIPLFLAGLLFYLILPIVKPGVTGTDVTFFEALKANLSEQKAYLTSPYYAPKMRLYLFLISLTSFVPVLIMSFRLKSMTTETSRLGQSLLSILLIVVALAFTVAGVAAAAGLEQFKLTPERILNQDDVPGGIKALPFLTTRYLSALSVGYFLGFLIIVLTKEPRKGSQRGQEGVRKIYKAVGYAVAVAAVVGAVFAAVRSLPAIRVANGPALSLHFTTQASQLPGKPAVLLSDDSLRLFLLKAALQQSGNTVRHIFLDTGSLNYPEYHRQLKVRYPEIANQFLATNKLADKVVAQPDIQGFVVALSTNFPVYYLHPSFGYYFERFYPEPKGLVYELKLYPQDALTPPAAAPALLDSTDAFWKKHGPEVAGLLMGGSKTQPGNLYLQSIYSRAVNDWGVFLQRNKRLSQAAEAFKSAAEINPDNFIAKANLEFNAGLQKGSTVVVTQTDDLASALKSMGQLEFSLNRYGFIDEVTGVLRTAESFASGNNLRQALITFLRALELDPTNLVGRVGLMKTYVDVGLPDLALRELQQIRASKAPLSPGQVVDVLFSESIAYLNKGNQQAAESVLKNAYAAAPDDPDLLGLLTKFYLITRQVPQALATLERKIGNDPKSPIHIDKAALLIQTGQPALALEEMNRFLAVTPGSPPAQLNRATSLLALGKLDEAKAGYDDLLRGSKKPLYQAHLGLHDIAVKQKNWGEATLQAKKYLEHAPRNTAEYQTMERRLDDLKTEKLQAAAEKLK